MFDRFSEKAIKVIMIAQEESRRLGHNFVGTEQLLLGILGEGTGIAAKTLRAAGVYLKDARVEVEKIIGRGAGFVPIEIPFTPGAKRLLQLSFDEAVRLKSKNVSTEHLLLALLHAGESPDVAIEVLCNLGANTTELRQSILKVVTVEDE